MSKERVEMEDQGRLPDGAVESLTRPRQLARDQQAVDKLSRGRLWIEHSAVREYSQPVGVHELDQKCVVEEQQSGKELHHHGDATLGQHAIPWIQRTLRPRSRRISNSVPGQLSIASDVQVQPEADLEARAECGKNAEKLGHGVLVQQRRDVLLQHGPRRWLVGRSDGGPAFSLVRPVGSCRTLRRREKQPDPQGAGSDGHNLIQGTPRARTIPPCAARFPRVE
mmetsp:Transcript_14602/g.55167  ORF Transcript_14602/g.55167 Transcript_14602/m.55167 type:complete len:224 (+) Transcript_14602:1816-2487(+)